MAFSFDMESLNQLITDLQKEQADAEVELETAREKLAELVTELSDAQADFDKRMAEYEQAMQDYNERMAEAVRAHAERVKNGEASAGSAPDYSSCGSPPTRPDESELNAIKEAITAQEELITALQTDIEALQTMITGLQDVAKNVVDTEAETTQFLLEELVNLIEFTGTTDIGSNVAAAVERNADGMAGGGYEYVLDENGNKIYTDIYKDMHVPDYVALAQTMDAATLAALMAANGCGVEMFLYAQQQVGNTLSWDEGCDMMNNSQKYKETHDDVDVLDVLSDGGSLNVDGVVMRPTIKVGQLEFEFVPTGDPETDKKLMEALQELDEIGDWLYAEGTGRDCSGFTKYFLEKLGLDVSGYSYTQIDEIGEAGGTVLEDISLENLQTGDILRFTGFGDGGGGSHMGIYLGDGVFIHLNEEGEPIHLATLTEQASINEYGSTVDSYSGWWLQWLTSAARPKY